MFAGFDPEQGQTFFERKRWQSMLGAVLFVGGTLGGAFYVASLEAEEPVEEEIIEAEIAAFEMDEEVQEEEPEPEPEPPPPPDKKKVKRSKKPTPAPEIANPDAIDENPEEGEISTDGPGYAEGGDGNTQGSGTNDEPEPKPKAEPKPDKPKPKKTKKQGLDINPDKPVERPAGATAVKQTGGKPPVYPGELKKRNITGKVKVRLVIYKDGSVKGATVLAKSNSVNQEEEPELYAKANKLFLTAVQRSLPTWTFKPSMYEGKPITVYQTITIPFTLN